MFMSKNKTTNTKKAATKKDVVKKTTPKKTAAKKATPKKTVAKKATPKKNEAKKAKAGMWAGEFLEPEDWRRENRERDQAIILP